MAYRVSLMGRSNNFSCKSVQKNPLHKSPLYVKTAICWAVTQRIVVIPYPYLETTYGSHLQGSRNPDVDMNMFCTERRHVFVFSVEDSQVVASCLQNPSAHCSSPPFCRISRSTRLLYAIHEAEFSQLCSFDVILLWHLTPTWHTRRNLCIDVWCSSKVTIGDMKDNEEGILSTW